MNELENRETIVNKIALKVNENGTALMYNNIVDNDNEAELHQQSVASHGRTIAIREVQEELSMDIYREFRIALKDFYVNKSNFNAVPLNAFLTQWGIIVIKEWDEIEVKQAEWWSYVINKSIQIFYSLEDSCTYLPPSIIGSQLLRQFFIDLLGRTTDEALVFDQKTRIHYGESRIISKEWKLFTAIIVTLLNV